jgi:hypothetical protein
MDLEMRLAIAAFIAGMGSALAIIIHSICEIFRNKK